MPVTRTVKPPFTAAMAALAPLFVLTTWTGLWNGSTPLSCSARALNTCFESLFAGAAASASLRTPWGSRLTAASSLTAQLTWMSHGELNAAKTSSGRSAMRSTFAAWLLSTPIAPARRRIDGQRPANPSARALDHCLRFVPRRSGCPLLASMVGQAEQRFAPALCLALPDLHDSLGIGLHAPTDRIKEVGRHMISAAVVVFGLP